MLYLEKKYVGLLSARLKHFKQKADFLWNFRCPVCGDSDKNSHKARGYIYRKKDALHFKCHNCGTSSFFTTLLKVVDPTLHSDYVMEYFKDKSQNKKEDDTSLWRSIHIDTIPFKKEYTPATFDLPTIESLPEEHKAKQFLLNREIPRKWFKELYYASDFRSFVDDFTPAHEKELPHENRIIIPFYDLEGELQGVQGRALGPSKAKYITIKRHDDAIKIFGLNKVNTDKTIYVVEGPIDSMFLENAIASMDSSLYNVSYTVGPDKDYVLIFDNEPRNKEINKHIRKAIDLNYKVCIWPDNIKEKDINEMVLAGSSGAAIQHIIDRNTYSGLMAQLQLTRWSKV
jgi:transcription elongation factor Elf1